MEKISNDYRENVRVLDGLLGVGRSCDMVSRDYLIGGRRARLWVVDGFGSDSILERMGAFWLTLKPENVVGPKCRTFWIGILPFQNPTSPLTYPTP